jgi:hypothetical protein
MESLSQEPAWICRETREASINPLVRLIKMADEGGKRNSWLTHVKKTMKAHKGQSFKSVLKMAKKTYKGGAGGVASTAHPVAGSMDGGRRRRRGGADEEEEEEKKPMDTPMGDETTGETPEEETTSEEGGRRRRSRRTRRKSRKSKKGSRKH